MAGPVQPTSDDPDKPYDTRIMKRLLGYIKPFRTPLIVALTMNILISALGPLRPLLTQIAIDDYIAKDDQRGLLLIIIALVGALLIQAVFQYILTYLMRSVGQQIIHNLRVQVFTHASKMSLAFFDRTPVGRVVTRVTNDIDALDELFSSGIVMIMSDVLQIIWILCFMFYTDVKLSLITMTIVPVLVLISFMFRVRARQSFRDVRKYVSGLNSFMQERVSGIGIVQLFSRQKAELAEYAQINGAHRDANNRTIFYYALYFPAVELLSAVVVALIVWYGGGQVVQGAYSFGVLLAFSQYLEMFFRPIYDLSDKYNVLQNALASSERIFELLDTDSPVAEPENPATLTTATGEVEFDHVSFAYNAEDWVLRDVSFHIKPGETVAIVGATGSGKTTTINLLNRFYDVQQGRILVDGRDIREYRTADLRSHISIVLQDIFLFPGTVRDNITLENDAISLEKVQEAARQVGADGFIRALADGYDTKIMAGGTNLSVGQRQLLSFARALAYDPRILILDEATSSVDTETEQTIQRAILQLLEGRTSIVIAHRLSTIRHADTILVMHKGQIRETGNHASLLAQGGIYSRLYQLQYKDQEASAAADAAERAAASAAMSTALADAN